MIIPANQHKTISAWMDVGFASYRVGWFIWLAPCFLRALDGDTSMYLACAEKKELGTSAYRTAALLESVRKKGLLPYEAFCEENTTPGTYSFLDGRNRTTLNILFGGIGPVTITKTRKATTLKGLGDYTERLLQSIGITEERYKDIKQRFGLASSCNCEARKLWLNNVTNYLRSTDI
jgi:hypothetical protein